MNKFKNLKLWYSLHYSLPVLFLRLAKGRWISRASTGGGKLNSHWEPLTLLAGKKKVGEKNCLSFPIRCLLKETTPTAHYPKSWEETSFLNPPIDWEIVFPLLFFFFSDSCWSSSYIQPGITLSFFFFFFGLLFIVTANSEIRFVIFFIFWVLIFAWIYAVGFC